MSTKLSPGDRVVCLVSAGAIINVYDDRWSDEYIFDIVCTYEGGYLIKVPSELVFKLRDSILIDNSNFDKFGADKRFIGDLVYYITDHKILSIYSKIDGMCCNKCQEFYPMAEANQENGTMVCWNCRKYPFFR